MKREFRSSRWWSNVQALKYDAGMTNKDISTYIGHKDTYLDNAVKNGGVPNVADALGIAELFDVSVEELAFGAIGLQIRQKQLEEELARIKEEIADAEKDVQRIGGSDDN